MVDEQNQEQKRGDTKLPLAKELYTKGGELFEENKFDEAIDLYSQAIKVDPTYSSAYFNRSLSYAILNKYEDAVKDAETVMRIEPDSADAPYVMGIISEYQNDFKGAKEWYEKSLVKNPKYEQAKARLDQLKKKMDRPVEVPGLGSAAPTAVGPMGGSTVIKEGQLQSKKWFKSDLTFKDVVGNDAQKKLIYENIILAIRKPELLKAYGKKLGLGVLFYGPPGGGKTYLVKAIAGETNSNVLIAQINEIVDMYAGNTEKNMHAIFEQARKSTPAILFFDEVDAMGGKREGGGEGQNYMRMAVNQFLQEMDGVEKNPEGVFVLGATNQPWDMDPALKRSGRFGEQIYFPPPNYSTRKAAFIFNTRKMPLAKFIQWGRLARATMGFSQADIAEIADKAALIPAVEEDMTGKKRPVKMKDFLRMIKQHGGSLDEWYAMIKKEIISKTETQIVEGKKQEIIKEGKLTAEEKQRYKSMIKDVKWNVNPFWKFVKRLVRGWALYLF